jgi:hypothetical protein
LSRHRRTKAARTAATVVRFKRYAQETKRVNKVLQARMRGRSSTSKKVMHGRGKKKEPKRRKGEELKAHFKTEFCHGREREFLNRLRELVKTCPALQEVGHGYPSDRQYEREGQELWKEGGKQKLTSIQQERDKLLADKDFLRKATGDLITLSRPPTRESLRTIRR